MALAALLTELRQLYAAAAAADPEAAALLAPVRQALAGASDANGRPEARRLPAAALFQAALPRALAGPLAGLAAAFAALEPQLRWVQNPNYSDARLGEGYMAGYAYANAIGPDGPLDLPGVQAGLLVLGPGRLYPDHAHPAAELYHVMAGTADWRRGAEDWVRRAPGACIVHRPWVKHATRTGEETLLAWYCWQGEVKTYADLVAT